MSVSVPRGLSRADDVAFDRSWEREEPAMVAKSLLAPSRKRGASQVDLRYHVGDRPSEGGNWIAPEPVCVTMSRNELTILRYEYDPAAAVSRSSS